MTYAAQDISRKHKCFKITLASVDKLCSVCTRTCKEFVESPVVNWSAFRQTFTTLRRTLFLATERDFIGRHSGAYIWYFTQVTKVNLKVDLCAIWPTTTK